MIKKIKKRSNRFRFPIIGKYIDTPTKAELSVVYFLDDLGKFKLSVGTLPDTVLGGCRFQLKFSEIKSKKRFYKRIKPFLDFSAGFKELDIPVPNEVPVSFGLLKLRKGKQRMFVIIQSADQFFRSKVVNVLAVKIDNLLYMDLVGRFKNKA